MSTILLICLGVFLFMFYTWGAYIGVMNLMDNRDELTIAAKFFAYPFALQGILMDVLLNLVIGTVLFLELPHELLFTKRLQRQLEVGKPWRANIALWLCTNLLDPFDSKGYHCRKPK